MIAALIARIRRWLRRRHAAGLEDLFAAVDPSDPLLIVSSLNPSEVGRQASRGAAILDTAAWLEASGFDDLEAGERQRYAAYLLARRAAYEQQGALT